MNSKTVIEFGLSIIWRIMEISVGVITLLDLHNSPDDTKAEFNIDNYNNTVLHLLQIRPLLRLDSRCYCGWDLYYAWAKMLLHMGPLLHLGSVVKILNCNLFTHGLLRSS